MKNDESFTFRHTLMGDKPNILKTKPLCLINCLILEHSGSSNRATLIQASDPDPTTKLDKHANIPSSATSTPPSEFHNQLGLENPKSDKLLDQGRYLSTQGISYYTSLVIALRSAIATSFVFTNNSTQELLSPFRYRKIL
jgi:hypothetical protein